MPLTTKGTKIRAALTKEYGESKGEEVLYAGKNAGTFTGIDSARLDEILNRADAIEKRMDALRK